MNASKKMTIAISSIMVLTFALLGFAATAAARADRATSTLRIDQTLVGSVDFLYGVPGVYGDALSEPSAEILASLPDLGAIDLAFWLEQTGGNTNTVTGYVDVATTLVFTMEHTIDTMRPTMPTVTARDAGPQVTGTFDGVNLTLESERIDFSTASGTLGQRQFRLIATVNNGVATGEYRETVWGYSIDPQTIVGDLTLNVIESPSRVPTSIGATRFSVSANRINLLILVFVIVLVLATLNIRQDFKE